MRLRLPKIEIHTWGGLGSQLYALALRIEVMERYPNRDVEMHLHTGGVTKRLSELEGVIDSRSLFLVSDFSESVSFGGFLPKRMDLSGGKAIFKSRMLPFLLRTGFVSRFDNVEQKLRVHPWLRQIRGHYSNRRIPMPILKKMYSDLLQSGFLNAGLPITEPKGIHYRLGDLLVIGTKNPTSIENLKIGIELANQLNPEKNCLVFSDSVNSACKMLVSQSLGLEYKSGSGNTWKAISDLVQIEIFIGTASKVTEWITIFRLLRDSDSISIIPKSLKPLIERQFGTSAEFRNLYFY